MKTVAPYGSFPNDPCFSQLVSVAEKNASVTIVDDPGSGVKADYNRLLRDIANVQRTLRNSLSLNPSRGNALKDESVYVWTLLGPNYTFLVSLLALLATGCAGVPLCMAIPSGYKSIIVHDTDANSHYSPTGGGPFIDCEMQAYAHYKRLR